MLPAFALTLVVNAVLVLVAIRALRSGQGLPRASTSQRPTLPLAPDPAAPTQPKPDRTSLPETIEAVSARKTDPAPRTTTARLTKRPTIGPEKRPVARKPSAAKPSRRPRSDGKRSTGQGSRRRFALPPMDEDHERVNRTIETFLTTPEETALAEPSSDHGDDSGMAGPTTVAVVAIEGLAELDTHDHPTADALAATVERALRGAARSSDRVAEVAGHVFRVTLPGRGALAAGAYLRGVRATDAPSLESAATPIRLATATAAALDGDLDAAFVAAIRHVGASAAARRATADAVGSMGQPPGRVSGG
jgi:GGDEF domain-containing protein